MTQRQGPENLAPERDDHLWDLACKVIDLARGLVVAQSPFLSSAIGLLKPVRAQLADPFATDGQTLHVDPDRLLATFARTREAPAHDFVHVLLHCVLLHPFVDASVDGRAWDLACDIVAESLVTEVVGARGGDRGDRIATALSQVNAALEGRFTTERLYRALVEGAFADERGLWGPLFHVDDHGAWPPNSGSQGTTPEAGGQAGAGAGEPDGPADSEPSPSMAAAASSLEAQGDQKQSPRHDGPASSRDDGTGDSGSDGEPTSGSGPAHGHEGPGTLSETQRRAAEQAWERAAKSLRVDLETLSRTRGSSLGNLVRELEVGTHERVDYREFLRQFAVEHEDMRLSDDEFDYVFYTYGLELYGNVPLVEPLEYRNERRIRDFAIVIDTSSSVSAKVVQEFVDTTFDVLSSEGGFFSQTNIHIIQADARVQSDAKITCMADLDRWRRNIKLRGFGGTDFRPAFQYVQQLRQQGEFEDLQGLVYFTDGWGIYPDRMPPYKCAFVFYDEDHRPELVPPWAIQVVLHPGQFESLSVY